MKTIRMPQELLTKWLAALRSGEYAQTKMAMKNDFGYCCLGVLVAVGEPQYPEELTRGTPSQGFRERNGISFICTGPGGSADDGNPYLPTLDKNAACANDTGATFAEIADAIEACAEGY